jgi:hypothetical protein
MALRLSLVSFCLRESGSLMGMSPFEDESVIVGQGRLIKTYGVEFFVFEPDGRVLSLRGHFLEKNVFDIFDAKGLVGVGVADGLKKAPGAIFFLERKEPEEAFLDGIAGACKFLEITPGLFAKAHEGCGLAG